MLWINDEWMHMLTLYVGLELCVFVLVYMVIEYIRLSTIISSLLLSCIFSAVSGDDPLDGTD